MLHAVNLPAAMKTGKVSLAKITCCTARVALDIYKAHFHVDVKPGECPRPLCLVVSCEAHPSGNAVIHREEKFYLLGKFVFSG